MMEAKLKECLESISTIDNAFWQHLLEHSSRSELKKGDAFAKEGEAVKKIGFLLTGIIRIYYLDERGNEWNKAFVEPNSFLLSNINYEDKSQVYVEALTDCTFLQAPISFFVESLKTYPEMHRIYQHEIGILFKRKSEREVNLLKLNATERYLKFLETHGTIVNQVPQYHIASYLGITPTQLSRIKISIKNQQM